MRRNKEPQLPLVVIRNAALATVLSILSGCAYHSRSTAHYPKVEYDIVLHAVERPADVQERWGNYVVEPVVDEVDKYLYEDDLIRAVIAVLDSAFYLRLENKTNHTVRVLWDDAAYIDPSGQSNRVVKGSIIIRDRFGPQTPSVIPKGTRIEESVIPIDRITEKGDSLPLLPGGRGTYFTEFAARATPEQSKRDAESAVQKRIDSYATETMESVRTVQRMALLIPLEIQSVVNEYTFSFRINNATVPEPGNVRIETTTEYY